MVDGTSEPTAFDLAHVYHGVPFTEKLPGPPSILASLHAQGRTQPNSPYLTVLPAAGKPLTISYGALDALSRQGAHWLRAEIGAGPGDVVGLVPVNDAESVVTLFALLRTGCAVLMLNPTDPAGRLRQQAAAVGVKVIVRAPSVPADTLSEAMPAPDVLPPDAAMDARPDVAVEPMDDALLFGTSGSTAVSKLVAQSHYNAAVNAEALRRHHGLGPGQRILGCLPIHHVNGVHFTLFATLAAGAHAILASSFDPFSYRRLIVEYRPRIASVVPSILDALVEMRSTDVLPAAFDYFVSAAAPLSARTARAVATTMGARVLQGYGLTETTNFSTTLPGDLSPETYARLMQDTAIPSIGTALYGNEVAVVREDGTHASPGEIGELCMRGHNVMMRYQGNAAATSNAFRRGWFHSQDLGFCIHDESGRRFFVITGRIKNIAKVRGESVSLEEMERLLRALPEVLDAACVSRPHKLMGEEIIAGVVCPAEISDGSLRAHLRLAFAPSALPRRFVRLEQVPRTPTGKIRRAELASHLAALIDGPDQWWERSDSSDS